MHNTRPRVRNNMSKWKRDQRITVVINIILVFAIAVVLGLIISAFK